MTNQVCPLGAPDYSSYLLNIANSGADVFININFGNDAVQSIKQAKQFGILDKMTLVVPYNTPFLAKQVGPDMMKGVYAATDFWWTLEDKYPARQDVRRRVRGEIQLQAGMGRQRRLSCRSRMWADAVERAKTFYPPEVIKAYEAGQQRRTRRSARSSSAPPTTSSSARSSSSAARARRDDEEPGRLLRDRRDRAGRSR